MKYCPVLTNDESRVFTCCTYAKQIYVHWGSKQLPICSVKAKYRSLLSYCQCKKRSSRCYRKEIFRCRAVHRLPVPIGVMDNRTAGTYSKSLMVISPSHGIEGCITHFINTSPLSIGEYCC